MAGSQNKRCLVIKAFPRGNSCHRLLLLDMWNFVAPMERPWGVLAVSLINSLELSRFAAQSFSFGFQMPDQTVLRLMFKAQHQPRPFLQPTYEAFIEFKL